MTDIYRYAISSGQLSGGNKVKNNEPMKVRTPIKAIRAKCLDCCCNQVKEVKLCASLTCPLWPYRMGHRPTTGSGKEILEEDAEN